MSRYIPDKEWKRKGAPKPLAAGKHKKAARLEKAWRAKSK